MPTNPNPERDPLGNSYSDGYSFTCGNGNTYTYTLRELHVHRRRGQLRPGDGRYRQPHR